jgi:hypothetical protein
MLNLKYISGFVFTLQIKLALIYIISFYTWFKGAVAKSSPEGPQNPRTGTELCIISVRVIRDGGQSVGSASSHIQSTVRKRKL